MPTLCGMRRRGYTPESLRSFAGRIGVSKTNGVTELSLLEYFVREELNKRAPRVMAVLNPLRVVIENYPAGQSEDFEIGNNPEDPSAGTRRVPFSRELYIERDDFMENPPKKFFRLAPGREVRLRGAYFVTCRDVVKDDSGQIVELRCTYDPATRGGDAADGRQVKATQHGVSAAHAVNIEVRLYDRLFTSETPADSSHYQADLNPSSLEVVSGARLEPSAAAAAAGTRYQFDRLGYFCVDPDSRPGAPVFNRTVSLKDSWARVAAAEGGR
jgi:glutaminyl-tRNA synthetase